MTDNITFLTLKLKVTYNKLNFSSIFIRLKFEF